MHRINRVGLNLLAIIGLMQPIFGQTTLPYTLNLKKDLIIGGGSLVMMTTAYAVPRTKPTWTPQDFAALNPSNVNGFDRKATQYYSTSDDHLRTYMLVVTGVGGAIALPLMAYTKDAPFGKNSLDAAGRKRERKLFVDECLVLGTMYAEGLVFNLGTNEWFKKFVDRARPYAYNPHLTYAEKSAQDYLSSFYSNTTALQWYTAGFIAKVVNDWCPHSAIRYYIWGGLGAYSVVQGYLGVRSGQHFPTDVITGVIIGGSTGILIPALHKTHRLKGGGQSANKISWNLNPGVGVGGKLQMGITGTF